MDRLKMYFNKLWNPTVMDDATPIPALVLPHLSAVYWTLFITTFISSFGAKSHQIQNIDSWTWITTLIFVASITLLSKIQQEWQISRFTLLVAAAYCFGASIGPPINCIVVVDQSDIIKVLDGASVFFSCYSVSVFLNKRRDLIYEVAEFFSTILVPAWMVLSPMSPELTMLVYLLLWPFNITMRVHTQESIYIANHGERYFVSRAIAFFTDFLALTAPRHMGGVMLGNIWGFLRHR